MCIRDRYIASSWHPRRHARATSLLGYAETACSRGILAYHQLDSPRRYSYKCVQKWCHPFLGHPVIKNNKPQSKLGRGSVELRQSIPHPKICPFLWSMEGANRTTCTSLASRSILPFFESRVYTRRSFPTDRRTDGRTRGSINQSINLDAQNEIGTQPCI